MRQPTGLSKTVAVLLLVLLTAGMGWYIAPRLAQLGSGETVHWQVDVGYSEQASSPYEEQMLLQELYADSLRQDIVSAIEQVAGQGTVQATVLAQLDLTRERIDRQNLSRQLRVKELLESTGTTIRKLSASILIDGQMIRDERGHSIYQPRTKAEIAQYTKLAKGIMGFDEERGDMIEVLNLPFKNRVPSLLGVPIPKWINGLCFIAFAGMMIGLIWYFILPMLRLLIQPVETGSKVATQNLFDRVEELCRQSSERAADIIRRALKRNDTKRNGRHYHSADYAAIVLLAINKDLSRRICRYLSVSELRQLGMRTGRLGSVPSADVKIALEKFIRAFNNPVGIQGSSETARSFLQEVHPEGQHVYSEMRLTEKGKTIWEQLEQLEIGDLCAFLQRKKPETAALILSSLSDEKAGQILTILPVDTSRRILVHLSHLKRIHPDILEKLSMEIAPAVYELLHRPRTASGAERVAAIMKTITAKEQEKLMTAVGNTEQGAERHIRACLKQWDDIMKLSDTAKCKLLKYCDRTIVATALSDLPKDVFDSFARYMTPTIWQVVQQTAERVDKQKAEAARATILKTARMLNLFG